MTTVKVLEELAEQMGLKGTDLRDFIKEQQEMEIEERTKQREEQEKQQERIKEQKQLEERQ